PWPDSSASTPDRRLTPSCRHRGDPNRTDAPGGCSQPLGGALASPRGIGEARAPPEARRGDSELRLGRLVSDKCTTSSKAFARMLCESVRRPGVEDAGQQQATAETARANADRALFLLQIILLKWRRRAVLRRT